MQNGGDPYLRTGNNGQNPNAPPQYGPGNSRHRTTTKVTINVPGEDQQRSRTPDTFEKEFNAFFQKNASDLYEERPIHMNAFSDFASRHHNSRLLQEFPEFQNFPDQRSMGFHHPRSPLFSSGYQSTHPGQPNSPRSTYGHYYSSESRAPASPNSQSTNRRTMLNQEQPPIQPEMDMRHPQLLKVGMARTHRTGSMDEGTQTRIPLGLGGKESDDKGSMQRNQSDEELRKQGPSYPMFKMDNPQLEISEEFPNRERMRKMSKKASDAGEKPPPHYNLYSPPSEESERQSGEGGDGEGESEERVPDWQANVQIGDTFLKRHLSATRQGHTVQLTAKKITESVRTGRSQVTREWRVVAPEIVDADSIVAEFVEDEKKLVITGFFDKMHEVKIN